MPYLLVSFSKRRTRDFRTGDKPVRDLWFVRKAEPGKACFCVDKSQLIIETMSVGHTLSTLRRPPVSRGQVWKVLSSQSQKSNWSLDGPDF